MGLRKAVLTTDKTGFRGWERIRFEKAKDAKYAKRTESLNRRIDECLARNTGNQSKDLQTAEYAEYTERD